jgi:hypothetical protein
LENKGLEVEDEEKAKLEKECKKNGTRSKEISEIAERLHSGERYRI